MSIELSGLLESDGRSGQYSWEPLFSTVSVSGESFPVTAKGPVDITVVNTGAKVLELTLEGTFTAVIPCARCLEPVEVDIPLKLDREADLKLSDEERLRLEEPVDYVTGTKFDPDILLTCGILTDWPIRVLCKEDCKGLCSHCGANLNVTTCDCKEEAYDPRMAAILDIFNKRDEEV
ncbi:MAG: DUF177 domain-containing protein [Eubacterium sp.]|nr:DUF177 domain-containing protein [Eubacterium sp.]